MAIKTTVVNINGVLTTLTYNATTKKYEGTITAPSTSSFTKNGKYYPVTITATDEAGNVTSANDTHATLGASLRLVVKEKVAPVSTITAPQNNGIIRSLRPTITWTITDNDSGVNPNGIALSFGGNKITTGITKTAITGGYSCSYIPITDLEQGINTVTVFGYDNDNNLAVEKSVTFTCDTTSPTLIITAPTNALLTKTATITCSGTATDAISNPCSVTVKHNSGTATSVPMTEAGAWSKVLTLIEGLNTIVFTATDSVGNISTITRTVTLDTVAPVIKSVSITPNPVDAGKTFVISIDATD